MFEEMFSASVLTALFQVIMIDLVLAGDNAVVIGLAAAGLPKEQRGKVIVIGIVAATVLRIVLALMTTQLLQVVGLLLAGGIVTGAILVLLLRRRGVPLFGRGEAAERPAEVSSPSPWGRQ